MLRYRRPQSLGRLGAAIAACLFGAAALAETKAFLSAASAVIKDTAYPVLITIDQRGQPKARVVEAFPPDSAYVVWVATKPVTRKVQEIRAHPKVTLHYFNEASRSYVSIMGKASLVEDTAIKAAMRRDSDSDKLYPNFPEDYLLIRVDPIRLEGILPGFRGDPDTWEPVGVDFPIEALVP